MLIARYADAGRVRLGVVSEGIARAIPDRFLRPGGDVDRLGVAALRTWARADLDGYLEPGRPLAAVELLAPVPRPEKIIGLGGNYAAHAEEHGVSVADHPIVFAKFPNSILDPFKPIEVTDEDRAVDYEGELCVVIGHAVRDVTADAAMAAVAGYTVANDVSARTWQLRVSQWTLGKSFDTYCPIGPWLATRESVPDPQALGIETRIGETILQSSSTSLMVYGVAELVSYLSRVMTLVPGDLVLTGTPAGVGHARIPPRYLTPGETVTVTIERIGSLSNPVARRGARA